MRLRIPFLLALLALLPSTLAAQSAQERLWDASIAGDTAAIRAAAGQGAVVDSLDTRTNPNGRRALNWAAWNDRVDAIALLLELGATIDAQNRTGFTPLHHAAEAGTVEAARALLAAGARTTIVNLAGLSALDVAQQRGNADVAALLEAAATED